MTTLEVVGPAFMVITTRLSRSAIELTSTYLALEYDSAASHLLTSPDGDAVAYSDTYPTRTERAALYRRRMVSDHGGVLLAFLRERGYDASVAVGGRRWWGGRVLRSPGPPRA